jgi:hypothetical protein
LMQELDCRGEDDKFNAGRLLRAYERNT